jgi:hypothetical protein
MIETLSTIFVVGTVWFWITCLVASVIITATVENDNYVAPTIISIILGIAYWKYLSLISWQAFVIGISVYIVVGMIWSTYRWYNWVCKRVSEYKEDHGRKSTFTTDQKEYLISDVTVYHHKDQIIAWIMFWPWSMIWNLTGDFFNMVYYSMIGIYDKISKKALSKFDIE